MGENLHEHHRRRLKAQFGENGLQSFNNHQILELLLFYAIPRKDTNELAHRLIDEFGSLHAVLEASPADLCRVPGVGEHAASLLHLCGELLPRYYSEKYSHVKAFSCLEDIANYLTPLFMNESQEKLVILCLNTRLELLGCHTVCYGDITTVEVPTRKIMEIALRDRATAVLLAHNHPAGYSTPSEQDSHVTHRLVKSLKTVDIDILDHLVFAGGEYTSMRQTPRFAPAFTGLFFHK